MQQRKDSTLRYLIEAKEKGFKPEWSDISDMKDGMKYYWQKWDSLELGGEVLQYVNTKGFTSWLTVIPSMPKYVSQTTPRWCNWGGGI